MKNYLDIFYSRNNKPLTNYPEKLIDHIIDIYQLNKSKKILEAGCGLCDHLRIFKNKGFQCYGFDLEKVNLKAGLNKIFIRGRSTFFAIDKIFIFMGNQPNQNANQTEVGCP